MQVREPKPWTSWNSGLCGNVTVLQRASVFAGGRLHVPAAWPGADAREMSALHSGQTLAECTRVTSQVAGFQKTHSPVVERAPRHWLHAKSTPAGIGDIHYMGALAVPCPAIRSDFCSHRCAGAPKLRPHIPCSSGATTITLQSRKRAKLGCTWLHIRPSLSHPTLSPQTYAACKYAGQQNPGCSIRGGGGGQRGAKTCMQAPICASMWHIDCLFYTHDPGRAEAQQRCTRWLQAARPCPTPDPASPSMCLAGRRRKRTRIGDSARFSRRCSVVVHSSGASAAATSRTASYSGMPPAGAQAKARRSEQRSRPAFATCQESSTCAVLWFQIEHGCHHVNKAHPLLTCSALLLPCALQVPARTLMAHVCQHADEPPRRDHRHRAAHRRNRRARLRQRARALISACLQRTR